MKTDYLFCLYWDTLYHRRQQLSRSRENESNLVSYRLNTRYVKQAVIYILMDRGLIIFIVKKRLYIHVNN
jgi:hypothetical protein